MKHRRSLIAAGVVLLAVGLAAGAVMLAAPTQTERLNPGMRISVVTPPAPVVDPGGVMEVGRLTEGYRHVPPPAPQPVDGMETETGWWHAPSSSPDDFWIEPSAPEPAVVVTSVEAAGPRDSLGFGFEPMAASDRRVMRSAPPERRPEEGEGGRPEIVPVSGERSAVFY